MTARLANTEAIAMSHQLLSGHESTGGPALSWDARVGLLVRLTDEKDARARDDMAADLLSVIMAGQDRGDDAEVILRAVGDALVAVLETGMDEDYWQQHGLTSSA
jgi:hypothetical protein